MKTLLDNECHTLDLERGIVIATWKIKVIDLTVAQKAYVAIQKVTSGKKHPLLVKMSSIRESTKEARDFLASDESSENIVAVALYVDSVLGNFISSFFITINKPKIPYKIFNDETKAKIWLEQFVLCEI